MAGTGTGVSEQWAEREGVVRYADTPKILRQILLYEEVGGMKKLQLIGLIGAIAAGGYVVRTAYQASKLIKKLNLSFNTILSFKKAEAIDIPETLVQEAVKQAAKERAKEVVKNTQVQTIEEIKETISEEAQEAVDRAYGDVSRAVRMELQSRVDNLNLDRIKAEVMKEARDRALMSFEHGLNEIFANYKEKLDLIVDIYSRTRSAKGYRTA